MLGGPRSVWRFLNEFSAIGASAVRILERFMDTSMLRSSSRLRNQMYKQLYARTMQSQGWAGPSRSRTRQHPLRAAMSRRALGGDESFRESGARLPSRRAGSGVRASRALPYSVKRATEQLGREVTLHPVRKHGDDVGLRWIASAAIQAAR